MMPVGPASSPSGVFLLSEAFSFEKAPEQVPSELPKVSETFLICPLMLGPTSADVSTETVDQMVKPTASLCSKTYPLVRFTPRKMSGEDARDPNQSGLAT